MTDILNTERSNLAMLHHLLVPIHRTSTNIFYSRDRWILAHGGEDQGMLQNLPYD